MPSCPAHHVEAIVLAAGRSRRMGQPKQLLRLPDGDTVIERVIRNVRPFVGCVRVVVGHLGGQVAALAVRAGAEVVVNPEVDEGMLSSVQVGLQHMRATVSGALLCLGDQPEVDGASIAPVVRAAAVDIVIPTYQGRGGHPVYVPRRFFNEILELPADTPGGLRTVIRGHAQNTIQIELPGPELLQDMDTPEDYRRTLDRLTTPSSSQERHRKG